MDRPGIIRIAAVMALGLSLLPSSAISQQKTLKEQLVGTWTITSVEVERKDGTRFDPWGNNAKGIIIFTADGHVSLMNTCGGRPKFASNNRLEGTPEENKTTVQGTLAYFGAYTVNEADKSFTITVERSTFPNDEGSSIKRTVTSLSGDELKFTNTAGTIGGAPAHVAAKRAR